MDYIRIRNLRSLRDTDKIAMKKVTVLVGSNSSGKSTFLRIFPLLKQSFNKRINGPILWCGDDEDYVDFGSFEEALNYSVQNKEEAIRFAFGFQTEFQVNNFAAKHSLGMLRIKEPGKVYVEFAINHNKNTTYDYVSELLLVYNDYEVNVQFSNKSKINSLTLNGKNIDISKEKEDDFIYVDKGIFDISLSTISYTAQREIFKILCITEEQIDISVGGYILLLYSQLYKSSEISGTKIPELDENVLDKISSNTIELKKWVFLYYLPDYFQTISFYLKQYFMNVYYIAPVRATAERYYKLRNLAVDEVDCRGKNLPVFLNSLSDDSFQAFQKWTKENLGFIIETSTTEGHVSLKIKRDSQSKAVNLSDAGFGYSQMLPIVTQLWYIATAGRKVYSSFRRNIYGIPKTIVIEQPELHLHPSLQAKLIDIIAKVAIQNKVRFIIETHSETMVNRISDLINNQKLVNDDVGIIIFNKRFGDDETHISKSTFDNEGYLENWPIGFFEPEEE